MNGSSISDLLSGAENVLSGAQNAENDVSSILAFFQKPVIMVATGAVVGLIALALFRAANDHRDQLASAARLVLV